MFSHASYARHAHRVMDRIEPVFYNGSDGAASLAAFRLALLMTGLLWRPCKKDPDLRSVFMRGVRLCAAIEARAKTL